MKYESCIKYSTELFKMACTWFGEICSFCSLTVLPVPAWVLLNYVCLANHFEELRIILSILFVVKIGWKHSIYKMRYA